MSSYESAWVVVVGEEGDGGRAHVTFYGQDESIGNDLNGEIRFE